MRGSLKNVSNTFYWKDALPNEWTLLRVKDIGFLQNGISKGGEYFGSGYPFVSYGNVYNNTIVESKIISLANSTKEDQKHYSVLEGDVFFTRTSESVDEIGISATSLQTIPKATFSGFTIRLRPNRKLIDKEYSKYLFLAEDVRNLLRGQISLVTRASLGQNVLGNLFIPIPLGKEQNIIAAYLDKRVFAIDRKISLLEKKISYYKELRKSLINDAVTKGLDKNVKLRDSGVEWIGQIPEHWEEKRLKDIGYLFSGLSGKKGDDFNQEENPNNRGFIPFTNIANNTYLAPEHLGTVVIEDDEKQNKVKKGDLFFLMSSEGYDDIGKTAALGVSVDETYLNSFCKGYRISSNGVDYCFLNYLMLSDTYRQMLIIEGKGFTRINLKMEKVKDFYVCIPPTKEEQKIIARYIDDNCNKIDSIISNIKKQISTLKELRKTLINDVVTGKIKVS